MGAGRTVQGRALTVRHKAPRHRYSIMSRKAVEGPEPPDKNAGGIIPERPVSLGIVGFIARIVEIALPRAESVTVRVDVSLDATSDRAVACDVVQMPEPHRPDA